MNDILIKSGRVCDPSQRIDATMDIGISGNRITALDANLPTETYSETIDVRGKIVTPGLIDIHAHVADGLIPIGANPDDCGVLTGVTTVVDAGSVGWANLEGMCRYVIPAAKSDVYLFLNVASSGLLVMPEIRDRYDINEESTVEAARAYPDVVKGIKVRATGAFIHGLGLDGLRAVKRTAERAGLPLMVHIGVEPDDAVADSEVIAFTRSMLDVLDKGDILSHMYNWKRGGLVSAGGNVMPEAYRAKERGVLFDVANAKTHYSFEIAKRAIEEGFLPFTISTDLTRHNSEHVCSLPVSMSKFMAAGLSLEQVIEMSSTNPAIAIGENGRKGALKIGSPADISIFELREGEYEFPDGLSGRKFIGQWMITPELTIKGGVKIPTKAATGADQRRRK
jgi:dihydroorotase